MGRACSCSIGTYYQRYANFTPINLVLLSKALTCTIWQFCAAKRNCILLLSKQFSMTPKGKYFLKTTSKQRKIGKCLESLLHPLWSPCQCRHVINRTQLSNLRLVPIQIHKLHHNSSCWVDVLRGSPAFSLSGRTIKQQSQTAKLSARRALFNLLEKDIMRCSAWQLKLDRSD